MYYVELDFIFSHLVQLVCIRL